MRFALARNAMYWMYLKAVQAKSFVHAAWRFGCSRFGTCTFDSSIWTQYFTLFSIPSTGILRDHNEYLSLDGAESDSTED